MTPADQLAYLHSLAARNPNARLGSAMARLKIQEKADDLKRAMEPKFQVLRIAEELRALGRRG